ncbi:trehalose 6-phosphate phosphorylase [Secundilactobacillus pentosiphilus]|uniref:Trehalose 6-phosphate phosphorylase n=1 Tax=Secundilactobacillus pentosiphilus TaxID=1714682 RepID=A0A1Z5IXJ5_9LACO|nr:glycosyl hydrolase family 65 protein [Secundilactobacillus pentosiphilus]GAX06308.1 trehalose 6-phosphate phosphorylase [Secundilactobacillus pentosiphilus]
MRTIALRVKRDSMELLYSKNDNQEPFRKFIITYDTGQTIGDNLEKIKVALAGLKIDAAILLNSLEYEFSDTIVGVNHNRIDIGLAITNMLNIPVVSQSDVEKNGLNKAVKRKETYNEWHLDYFGEYEKKRNYGQEAMLTIGNGYFGLRGAYVESRADSDNYPGTYVSGVYNQLTTKIGDHDVTNEDLVNMPNAQFITFGVDGQPPFTINKKDIQDIYRSLDLKHGVLRTAMHVQLSTGHDLSIVTTKVANMKNWHDYAIHYAITPLNFSGTLQIYSEIDGTVINGNVERYQDFDQHHLQITGMSSHENEMYMTGETKTSHIQFVVGSNLRVRDQKKQPQIEVNNQANRLQQVLSTDVSVGKTYGFEKNVTIYTDRETPADELIQTANDDIKHASYDQTAKQSETYWNKAWNNFDIKIDTDITSQKLTRVNLFHSMVAAAAIGSGKLDASVGARGLHGEAYRGHVFWDEMFILPFYTLHYPELTKQLLMYRYRRLDAARAYAKKENYEGAMYPWQSGQTGDEQSQFLHLNPITHQWDPDNSRLQRHVSLAIAYNVINYTQVSGDHDFMAKYGLEMLLSIAKFWISATTYDEKEKRYSIAHVMGPDEFHENYPNADEPGLTNNTYTNIMVAWLFNYLVEIRSKITKSTFKAVQKKSAFDDSLFEKMTDISHKLKLDINKNGIMAQFEGYFDLPTLDFDAYRRKYGDISRMDRILKAEDKTPDAYQVAKQADTLMAYYVLNIKEVDQILNQLGYHMPTEYLTKNIQYYLNRTTHGSTLSRIVYSVLTEMDDNMDQSWSLFSQALFSDYYDIQGGTTAEGIHLGVMGATLMIETRNYGGVDSLGREINLHPNLPSKWTSISFKQFIRGHWYDFTITQSQIHVTADADSTVQFKGKPVELKANQEKVIEY